MTTTEVVKRSAATIARLAAINTKATELLADIPTAEDDGGAGIYEMLLNAVDLTDLNRPWENSGLEAMQDQRLIIDGMTKLESDYAEGPGWYLLLHGASEATGDEVTASTSSLAIMLQCVQIYRKGWMPCTVIPRVSERKTRSGYEAWHLEIIPPGAPRPGDNLRRMQQRSEERRAAAQAEPDEPGY